LSFKGLLDHTARIWRRSESLGTYRETVASWEVVYASVPCTLKRKFSVLVNPGPGMVDSGERRVYFLPGVALEERDLVELTSGPDSPDWLEVESESKPRGHHVEARCVEYRGSTPEVES